MPRTFNELVDIADSSGISPDAGSPSLRKGWKWMAAGLLLVLAAFAYCEIADSYYFTQDDVLATELPGILSACRDIFSGGYPLWNPRQLLGSPSFWADAAGQTYPPTCISYAISAHVLGSEYATMEVFALIHLAAAYLLCFIFLLATGIRPSLSFAGALSYSLSGAALMMGRSWHAWIAILPWIPLLMFMAGRLARTKPGYGWILCTGLAMGVPFHIGFTQLWIYMVFFFLLYSLISAAAGGIPPARTAAILPAMLLGTALAAPVLVSQVEFSSDLIRHPGYGTGIASGLISVFLPYPLAVSHHPNFWGNHRLELMGHLYYFGTVFAVAFFVALLFFAFRIHRKKAWADNAWLVCGLAAFLLVLGNSGGLWALLGRLPLLSLTNNHPFRLLPFFVLFCAAGGGLLIERFLGAVTDSAAKKIGAAVAAVSVILLALNVVNCSTSFYYFGFKPYPVPPASLTSILDSGDPARPARLLPVGVQRSSQGDYAFSMLQSFPTVYSLYSFDGYDPPAESKPYTILSWSMLAQDPLRTARAYGVRWIIDYRQGATVGPESTTRVLEINSKLKEEAKAVLLNGSRQVLKAGNVTVHELAGSDPMAFPLGKPAISLPVGFSLRGATVDCSGFSGGGDIVINVLCWPEFRAIADGREVDIRPDEWNRCLVSVPPGAGRLDLVFSPDWGTAWSACLALLACCALAAIALRRVYSR